LDSSGDWDWAWDAVVLAEAVQGAVAGATGAEADGDAEE
jgi:hypothetical protein